MSEPGTDIQICIGFQDSISGLVKKSILTSLLLTSLVNSDLQYCLSAGHRECQDKEMT